MLISTDHHPLVIAHDLALRATAYAFQPIDASEREKEGPDGESFELDHHFVHLSSPHVSLVPHTNSLSCCLALSLRRSLCSDSC